MTECVNNSEEHQFFLLKERELIKQGKQQTLKKWIKEVKIN